MTERRGERCAQCGPSIWIGRAVSIDTIKGINESTDWPDGSSDGIGKVTEDIPNITQDEQRTI